MAARTRAEIEQIWTHVESVKKLTDRVIGIGPFGLGLDALLTWIPVVSPLYSAGVGVYLMGQALRARASAATVLRMAGYLTVDTATDVVPFAGSVVDMIFPGHLMAAKALQKDIESTHWIEELGARRAGQRRARAAHGSRAHDARAAAGGLSARLTHSAAACAGCAGRVNSPGLLRRLLLGVAEPLVQLLQQVDGRLGDDRAGREDGGDAHVAQGLDVLGRDDAADHDHDVGRGPASPARPSARAPGSGGRRPGTRRRRRGRRRRRPRAAASAGVWNRGPMSTSKPRSAKAVAMTFWPRSWPSWPILATRMRGGAAVGLGEGGDHGLARGDLGSRAGLAQRRRRVTAVGVGHVAAEDRLQGVRLISPTVALARAASTDRSSRLAVARARRRSGRRAPPAYCASSRSARRRFSLSIWASRTAALSTFSIGMSSASSGR